MSIRGTTHRPNILWISLEDTSPRFGCYGDPVARTPNIDQLAAEGRRYSNAFCVAGVCAPSRSAIITGMYPTFLGTHHMRTTHVNEQTPELPTPYHAVVPHYVKAFPEYLRAAGYYCTNNHKTDYQFVPPLTAWDECGPEAHWRNRDSGQPFFAVFNNTGTHESGMWERDDRPLQTDPDALTLPPYLPDTPRVRKALARHYDNIARSDAWVGSLLEQLEEDGLAQETILFLWSDHGEGVPRAKRWPYDAGIRIPLIIRWPGRLQAGSVSEQLVSLIDLAPTVLSITGVGIPVHLQGQPFLGERAETREYVFATRDRYDESYDMVRAVRDGRYKFISNYYPEKPYLLWIPYRNRHPIMQEMWRLRLERRLEGEQNLMFQAGRPPEELYDCHQDPHELNNLAEDPDHQDILKRMRNVLASWRSEFDRWGDVTEADMIDSWRSGGDPPETAPVVFIPITKDDAGTHAVHDALSLSGPVFVQLHSATQGASIAYKIGSDPRTSWRLYTEPLQLPTGATTTLQAQAVRIGYKNSEITSVDIKVM